MDALQICVIAAVVVLFGLVSGRLEGTAITAPMVFVAAGFATHRSGLVDVGLDGATVSILAEVALAFLLFSDAVRINTVTVRRELGLPVRLLGIGLPLSIGLGTFIVAVVLPDLDLWDAALVAAILAPTDAAVGQAVVEDRSVPEWVRQALNVESGLNDGIVLPAVLLFAALSAGEDVQPGFWVQFALRQVGLGVVIGLAVGWIGAWLLDAATGRGWITGINAQLVTLAFAVLGLAGAVAAGGNGFIAVFIAGLTFGEASDRSATSIEYTEDSSRLLSALTFFVFGNLIVPESAPHLTVGIAVCAAASLTIGRMLPVALAVATSRPNWRTVAFLGWFGPRGIASIVFALVVVEEAVPGTATEDVLTIVTWTVLASVVLHGASAGRLATSYGRWYESMSDDHDRMPESTAVGDHPIRHAPSARPTPTTRENLDG